MDFGDKLKKIRKEKGLTQKELGDRCGIAEPTIRRYESGNLHPKFETRQKIADALDVSIIELTDDLITTKDYLNHINSTVDNFMESLSEEEKEEVKKLQEVLEKAFRNIHEEE